MLMSISCRPDGGKKFHLVFEARGFTLQIGGFGKESEWPQACNINNAGTIT
jgi:hypothetical protein